MDKAKHTFTPGPWFVRRGDEWSYFVVTRHGELPNGEPNEWTVASINTQRVEKDGNMQLIAAAPELLEALIECLECEFAVTDKAAIAKAEAAIRKATGA